MRMIIPIVIMSPNKLPVTPNATASEIVVRKKVAESIVEQIIFY